MTTITIPLIPGAVALGVLLIGLTVPCVVDDQPAWAIGTTVASVISLYGAVSEFIVLVSAIPAADVAPVVHSSWEIRIDGNGWNEWSICKCKNCGREYKDFEKENYCPNCGAKMGERRSDS